MIKTKADWGRISRFVGIGLAATIAHAILLIILVEIFNLRPAYATVLAFLGAFIVSYLGHYHLTFKTQQPHSQALPSYGAIATIGALLNFTIILLLSDVLNYHYLLAFLVTIFTVPPLVYALSRDHAFNADASSYNIAKIWAKKSLWLPAVIFAFITLLYTLIYHYRVPYFDHWDIVPLFEAMQSNNLKLSSLFALHGSHWHASGYLVMLGLSDLTGMVHGYEVICSFIFAILGFVALAKILRRSATLLETKNKLPWLLGLSALIFFSLDQAANWLWGWQVAVFIHVAGVLWMIELMTRDRVEIVNTLLAILAAAIAIYGFATGWALVPLGFILLIASGALTHNSGRISMALWVIFSAGLLWHFKLAQMGGANTYLASASPDLAKLDTLIGLIHYSINFLASPIVRFARDISVLVTFIGLALAIHALLNLKNRPNFIKAVLPLLALMAYATGAALLTSYGRWQDSGVKHAFVSRYITFGNFFWIGIFALSLLAYGKSSIRSSRVIMGLLCLLTVLKVGNVISAANKNIKVASKVNAAAQELAVQFPNNERALYNAFSSPHQDINSRVDILRKNNVSLFRNSSKIQSTETK